MHFLRPKSFLSLVLIGFAMVALPFNLAMINAEFFLDRLAQRGSQAVYRSVSVIQESRNLVEQLLVLERRVRQYQVLQAGELLAGIEEKHKEFVVSIEHLGSLPLKPDQFQRLQQLGEGEQLLYAKLRSNGQSENKDKAFLEGFDELNRLARGLYDESQELIVHEVDALRASTTRARRILLWLAVLLVPVTGLFATFFTQRITKPIRQINRGISRLGEGDFVSSIEVGGPDDLRFLGTRLDWLRQRLDAAEKDKSKFISHVSHELKTPLASIREGTELLVEEEVGPLNDQQREIAWILRKNGVHLHKLIDNLLGFSRMQAKISSFHGIDVDFSRLIKGIVAAQRPAILKKNLDLKLDVVELQLHGDRERLRNVVDNLLSNAVKYTPVGGTIQVVLRRVDNQALFEVADSGPGIPESERQNIFKPFYQGSAPMVGPVQGTGIGLSIVQEYVRDHGAGIEVLESSLGGACFRVTLPLSNQEEKA
ncbi:sensor histidine kinase, HAMP domain-containing [Syntrophotalea carbinolica DSM 2380]|uniref:histidine kinase n=1 Tax=Syntrophotalea carbinolica (strain DSM 2380 / NBRC 103641 / GraBd1) TaxID=338963 RepID=Q3A788_SYNC1|nr:HAMP domain-containing sensor histidine kinase [Syntrophotalea carbinolica]ABA87756.1 sensor histidine kinase, HAMP domain-containing [Syntrophotalea carbinolica DSM 2380]